MITYGDMMTLLLCFFVLIVSFSEIRKEDHFQAVVEEIQQAFGMHGGGGRLPTDDDPALSLIQRLEAMRLRQQRVPTRSNTTEVGMDGTQPRVERIREGELFAVGTRITFSPGSAELTDEARRQLVNLAESIQLRGHQNIIELRGHASGFETGDDNDTAALWRLSYRRSESVMRFLTSDEVGIDANRFRLTANADREPLRPRAYTADATQANRRVELIVSEALAHDFTTPEGTGSN
jgi:chemotaxis protein MotB